jgi:hypothetical protein
MALRFFGKGGSEQSSCPSVSVDDKDGSFVFVGYPVNDPGEQVFRVPRELRKAIWEACGGYDPDFE